jgi:hypothetical protein
MWRVSIYILLFLMTLAVARAEEPPEQNCVQRAVVHVDRVLRDVHEELFKGDHQKFFDNFMPVDDFRLYIKPKFAKSLKKGEARYTVGFRFTF